MVEQVTQIRCPNCQNPIQAGIRQVLDVGQDPSSKARLLSGSLNVVRCPHCGYEGQLATPLVYHDPEKELLLTYMPAEVDMQKEEQERVIGGLINQIVERLPQEERKAYLLQPKSVLTLQGMVEQVLEADGITKEDIEAQQAKLRLFEQLIRTPEDELETFVEEHDEELDEDFIQLASLALQSTGDEQTRAAANQKLDQALRLSGVGKRLEAQQAEIRAAAESLQEMGEELTREDVLELLIEAPNEDRVTALVNLARQAMDYSFFQLLSDRIENAEQGRKQELEALRKEVLAITEQIDEAQRERAGQAAGLLRSLMDAEDLDQAMQAALPYIDELFLGTLEANLTAARERDNREAIQKLEEIQRRLHAIIRESLPPSMRLAQQVIETGSAEEAQELLEASPEDIDDQMLAALMNAISQLETADQPAEAERIRQIHRHAVRISMRRKMKEAQSESSSS